MKRLEFVHVETINSIDVGLRHRHRHLVGFARESPLKTRFLTVQQRNLASAATVHLINHIGYGAEPNSGTVEHQARRPFMFMHRLMQQDKCL